MASHTEKRGAGKDATEEAEMRPAGTEPVQYLGNSGEERGERLRIARLDAAADFSKEIAERWKKNQSCSRQLLADKYVHINESTVKKWATGEKPIPLAALELLPDDFALALVRRVFARKGMKL